MTKPTDVVKQVRKYTRRKFTPDEKIRIVLEGFRGDVPMTDLCRREGIAAAVYHEWSKEFLETGKKDLRRASLRNVE
jgi:transposase